MADPQMTLFDDPDPARRVRVEVDDEYGTVALVLDTARHHLLSGLAARAVRNLAAVPGMAGEDHARKILIAELTRQLADEEAYERIAGQRGLLPL